MNPFATQISGHVDAIPDADITYQRGIHGKNLVKICILIQRHFVVTSFIFQFNILLTGFSVSFRNSAFRLSLANKAGLKGDLFTAILLNVCFFPVGAKFSKVTNVDAVHLLFRKFKFLTRKQSRRLIISWFRFAARAFEPDRMRSHAA